MESKHARTSIFASFLLISSGISALAYAAEPIGVRIALDGQAEFYDTGTGLEFTPRGMNFARVNFADTADVHATFNVGRYNPRTADNVLKAMNSFGYNVVRVILNFDQLGKGLSQPGVNQMYMDNVIDFLRKAESQGIYVILTNTFLPANYYSIVNSIAVPANVEEESSFFFHPGFVKASQTLAKDVLESISASDRDLFDALFAYDVMNEAYFVWDFKPWTMQSGTFHFAGKNYDMSSSADRQRLADAAAIQWANRMTKAVKSVSPTTMVTSSLFTPFAVGRTGHDGVLPGLYPYERRAPLRARAFSRSNFDYVDVHVYPLGPGYSIDEDLATAEVQRLRATKPLLMGEYGAFKFAYPTIEAATQAIGDFLPDTCRFGFDGWLYWTWDTREQAELWYARESSGAMNKVVAPKYLPQICPS